MNYSLLAPELLLIGVAVAVIVIGLFLKEKEVLGYLSIASLIVALFMTLKTFNVSEAFLGYPFYNAIVLDSFAQFFNIIFLSIALMVCIASLQYYRDNPNQDEYYFLLLMATVGMMIVALSNNLIILFIGFELASLSTYALAGFDKRDPSSVEAALKYFVIGGLSSAILLFGMSLVYGMTGTMNIPKIAEVLFVPEAYGFGPIGIIAMIFLLAGFGFKMALVPFHMWAPDTYQGAPSVISALLAAGSKKMGFVAAFRIFMAALIVLKFEWYLAFAVLAVITMTLGNVVAILQKSVKRMLAYSSVAHAGYIAIAFVVAAYSSTTAPLAIAGGILHAFSHALGTAGAFVVTAVVGYIFLKNPKTGEADDIENYDGLGKTAPITALLMTIMLFSLAGIPPTFGFYSKFVLFLSAIKGNLLWLAIVAVLNSALSVYYYARVVMRMYWGKPKVDKLKEPTPYVIAMLLAVIAIALLGVYPSPISDWAFGAASALWR